MALPAGFEPASPPQDGGMMGRATLRQDFLSAGFIKSGATGGNPTLFAGEEASLEQESKAVLGTNAKPSFLIHSLLTSSLSAIIISAILHLTAANFYHRRHIVWL